MLNIIACFKWVIDHEDIKVNPETHELVLDRAGYRISDYDRFAIEEAVALTEQYGGSTTAVTVGLPAAKKSLKDALARGPEKAIFINDPAFHNLEPSQTAAILAQSISNQEYDLIICGEGSGDLYAQQVGPRLAEHLNIPCASFVRKITIEGRELIAERRVDEGIEVISMPLPALVTVLPEINSPRVPGLKDTLSAAKKPVVEITASDLGQTFASCLETVEIKATTMERNCEKFGAEKDELKRFIDVLCRAGVVD